MRRSRRLAAAAGGLMLAVLAACGSGGGGGSRDNDAKRSTTTGSAGAFCHTDERFDEGNTHVANSTDVTYSVQPPAGGTHWVSPAPAGIYSATQIPPQPPVVHALEHGYVAIWYRVDLAQADVDALEALATDLKPDVLLVPQRHMPVPVAATAWHHRLLCDRTDTAAVRTFVEQWRNQGPERVPHQ